MATEDQVECVHERTSILTAVGSVSALLGMSSYFMSYEYKDFDRMNVSNRENLNASYSSRKRNSVIIMVVAAVFYFAGIILLTLSMSLFPDERELQAFDIPSLLQQIRNETAQPGVNEAAILAGVSASIIALGMIQSAREFHKTEHFGWIGSAIYGAGWLGLAFAGAMNQKSISSLTGSRIAWTLPGAAAIVGGTFLFPWQLRHNYISGPSWPLVAIGYFIFGIGNSLVTDAPTLVSTT